MLDNESEVLSLETLRSEKELKILRLAEIHGARNLRVIGSVANASSREDSDLDLLVEFEHGRTLLDLIALKLDLEDLLGVTVDIATPNSLRYIRDHVLAEAVPL